MYRSEEDITYDTNTEAKSQLKRVAILVLSKSFVHCSLSLALLVYKALSPVLLQIGCYLARTKDCWYTSAYNMVKLAAASISH